MSKEHKWMSKKRDLQIKKAEEGRYKSKAIYNYDFTPWTEDGWEITTIVETTPRFNLEKFEEFYDKKEEVVCIEYLPINGLIKKICH